MKRLALMPIMIMAAVVLALLSASAPAAEPTTDEDKERQRIARWEPQIAAFEKEDEKNPPPENGILFVGSSSIRLWKLEESFGKLPVINRGFGGSQLADSIHYVDRLVLKHKPRTVVVYAGDNDLAGGKSPRKVADDFRDLAQRIHDKLPEARILYIGIKPSLKRWNLIDQVREANRLIAKQCQSDARLKFIDVDQPMLNADGKPREELFLQDGLHLNAEGYKLWTSLVEPHLQEQ